MGMKEEVSAYNCFITHTHGIEKKHADSRQKRCIIKTIYVNINRHRAVGEY